jgi:hypothetical protein
VVLPARSWTCTVSVCPLPAADVFSARGPSGLLAKPDRASLDSETVAKALLPTPTGSDGHVSVNVGGVLSILYVALVDASMSPLESTDRAVIVVSPSPLIVIGPVYLVHSVAAPILYSVPATGYSESVAVSVTWTLLSYQPSRPSGTRSGVMLVVGVVTSAKFGPLVQAFAAAFA